MKGEKNTKKTPRPPVQSEIARIDYEHGSFDMETKDWKGNPVTQKKSGYRFFALAIGPQGRYTAGIGPAFEGKTTTQRTGTYSHSTSLNFSQAADTALNRLLEDLWKDGWQPTSFGRAWYDFNLRRVVTEPAKSENPQSDSSDQSSATKTAATSATTPAQAAPRQTPAPANALPDAFQQALANYSRLRADYAAGRVNPTQYRAVLEQIRVQDAADRQWTLDGQSGKWLMWNGTAWVQSDPTAVRR